MPWGASPWGVGPWGDGPEPFVLVSVDPIRENVLRLTFNAPVYWSQRGDPDDGAHAGFYAVTAIAGTVGIDGVGVRPIQVAHVDQVAGSGGTQIDVTLDRAMSPYGTQYTIAVHGLRSTYGHYLPAMQVAVDGLQRGLPRIVGDQRTTTSDFSNPQSKSGVLDPLPVTDNALVLGSYPTDDNGDYALDEGVATLKKRIYRRLSTGKGRFRHLLKYGVTIPENVKRLARGGMVQALAADAEEQVRQEPEVSSASVTARMDPSGVAWFTVRARTNTGQTVSTEVPFMVTGG